MGSSDELKAEDVNALEQMLMSLPRIPPPRELRGRILAQAEQYLENEKRNRQMRWMIFTAACTFLACLLLAWTQGMRLKVLVPPPSPRDLVEMQSWQQQVRFLQANGRMDTVFTHTDSDEEFATPFRLH
ncbi:hypothetical protein [Thermogutta sp.]|uniref:hypothetical protein n=1 Tax=Thermogutta sp. TaxID=1962930 RepID=UPI00321FDA98